MSGSAAGYSTFVVSPPARRTLSASRASQRWPVYVSCARGHEELAQLLERIIVLDRGFARSTRDEFLVHSLPVEGNVAHFVVHAVADVWLRAHTTANRKSDRLPITTPLLLLRRSSKQQHPRVPQQKEFFFILSVYFVFAFRSVSLRLRFCGNFAAVPGNRMRIKPQR